MKQYRTEAEESFLIVSKKKQTGNNWIKYHSITISQAEMPLVAFMRTFGYQVRALLLELCEFQTPDLNDNGNWSKNRANVLMLGSGPIKKGRC